VKQPEIDLNAMLKRWESIARIDGVKLKNKRQFKIRLWLYLRLFRFAAFVAGMGYREITEDDEKRPVSEIPPIGMEALITLRATADAIYGRPCWRFSNKYVSHADIESWQPAPTEATP